MLAKCTVAMTVTVLLSGLWMRFEFPFPKFFRFQRYNFISQFHCCSDLKALDTKYRGKFEEN